MDEECESHEMITRETAIFYDDNIHIRNGKYATEDHVASISLPKTWYCPECGKEWTNEELDKFLKTLKKSKFGWRKLVYG